MRKVNLTPFKRNLLDSLDASGHVQGFHRSHAEHALRQMEEAGLTAKSLSGRWSITRAGREVLRA